MADDLRLQVVLGVVDKALGPIKAITQGSAKLVDKVAAAQAALRNLKQQDKAFAIFNNASAAMSKAGEEVKALQLKLNAMRREGTATAADMAKQERAIERKTAAYNKQRTTVDDLRSRLQKLGVTNFADAQRDLAANTAKANRELEEQKAKLDKLNVLKGKHAKQMMHMGMIAGGGVAAMAGGRQIARPAGAVMDAFSEQEDARASLSGSMMLADGSLPAEFKKLDDLAVNLGNRLPGTTADFYEMLTMLRRQGLSAQTILGGTGEAAAYLGVQLRMPVTEAAEFAAKMQDATQSTEAEMMGLMDTIQRTFYLGVDSNNMLQGFTKLSPVLSILKQKGLAATKALAPMLVMFDQAGMKGEASGNAVRKVMQGAMNTKKVNKANKDLAPGQRLNFTDGKGEFAGIDHMFAELEKLKGLTTEKRLATLQAIFGDDAETNQVLTVLMEKGKAGYEEVIAKMEAQADLRKRVEKQLATLTNVKEAAMGAFTNVMADAGATVEGDLKNIIKWLDETTEKLRLFVAENPKLVRWLMLGTMAIAGLSIGLGALAVTLATVFGPMLVVRFLLARMGLTAFSTARGFIWLGKLLGGWLVSAVRAVGSAIAWVARLLGPWLMAAMRMTGTAIMWAGRALFMLGRAGLAFIATPIGAALAVLALVAVLIWKNWDVVGPKLAAAWAWIKTGLSALGAWVTGLAAEWWNFGGNLVDGLINGIKAKWGELKNVVSGMAESVKLWFTTPVAIKSPSRVFMQYGGYIAEGTALGIAAKSGMVATATASMASLAMAAAPGVGGAGGAAAGGDTFNITVTVPAGADGQVIAQQVAREVARIKSREASAQLSRMRD